MAWNWRLEDADGTVLDEATAPPAATQSSQADAESWLGEHWRDLRDAGVAQVTLVDGSTDVYSMSLADEPTG